MQTKTQHTENSIKSTPHLHDIPHLKLLHQILPHSPHTRPLAKDEHRNCPEEEEQLDAAESNKDGFGAVGL